MATITARNHQFDVVITKESDQFSAVCLTASIASCGRTKQEALRMVSEAIELYIEDLTDAEIAELPKVSLEQVTLPRG